MSSKLMLIRWRSRPIRVTHIFRPNHRASLRVSVSEITRGKFDTPSSPRVFSEHPIKITNQQINYFSLKTYLGSHKGCNLIYKYRGTRWEYIPKILRDRMSLIQWECIISSIIFLNALFCSSHQFSDCNFIWSSWFGMHSHLVDPLQMQLISQRHWCNQIVILFPPKMEAVFSLKKLLFDHDVSVQLSLEFKHRH